MAQTDVPAAFDRSTHALMLVEGQEEYALGPHLDILDDPSRQLTINDVASQKWKNRFVPSSQHLPRIGYTDSAIWVRCEVLNPTPKAGEWMLELRWRPRKLTFFRESDTGFVERQAGRHVPASQWETPYRFPSFRLPLSAQRKQTFYLQIISSGTNIHLPLGLYSISAFTKRWSTDSLLWGIFFGILMFITGYGLVMFVCLRDRSYGFLAAMAGSHFFYRATVDGWSSLYLLPHAVQPHLIARDLALLAIYTFGLLFSQAFLETRQYAPRLHRAMTAAMLVYGLVSVVDLVFPVLGFLFKPLEATLLVLMMAAGIVRWGQGYRAARFFLVAWVGFIVCRLIVVLTQVLLLTAIWPSRVLDFVWIAVVFLWAVALADRVNLLKQERQEAISILQNSEQKLRGIFDHAFQFIGLLKPDGRIVEANQAALDFAGVSQSAVIGKFFWDTPWWRHSPAEQQRLRDAVERAARGQFVRYETTHPGPNGSLRSIDFSLKPVRDEKGQVVMLIPEGRDITGIKQTEATLRETQERYARLAEAAFDGIGVFEDGVLVEANERFAKMMGYAMLEILGKRNVDLAAPESADLILEQQRSVGEILYELVGRRKDGSTFPAEVHGVQVTAHGKPVRVAAIRDITERKQAEQALRERERHFQRLAQATFEGICVTENGVILDANEQLARMGGYELPELLGRPAIEFVAPQSREAVRWNFIHGDGQPYEILAQRKDGSPYPVEVRGHQESWDGRTIRVTALRDLTTRKQAEQALRESEERFRLVAERTGQMIYDLDIVSGRIRWAGAVPQLSGYSPEEFEQSDLKAWEELIHPEDRDGTLLLLDRAVATGQPFDAEYRFRRKDGVYIDVQDNGIFLKDDQGRWGRMLGTMSDITERRRSEGFILRVARSIVSHTGQSFLSSLVTELARALDVEYAFVAEIKKDSPGTMQTVAVLSNGQIAGNFAYDLRHTPCEDVMTGTICSYPSHVQTVFPMDDLLKEMKVEGYVGTPLSDSNGTIKGLMVVLSCRPILDVKLAESVLQIFAARAAAELERLEAEAEIRGLNAGLEQRVTERTAQLEYANQELESFSYSVSHDLSAPLRNISGFVELLQKRVNGALDEKSLRYLETISDEARRMGTLIESLLHFSKLSRTELQKTRVDLNRLVAEVQEQFVFEVQDRCIEWRIEPLPEVSGDWNLLKQVFSNFLSNAIKYTRTRPKAEITVGFQNGSPDEIVIFVRDNGVGFNMKHASKLFRVFQRLHSLKEFEGTGIGLANAQRIIHRHGGKVWVEAEEERGAAFFLTLPR
jgi:PAS domain S-box-containing protein